MATSRDILLKLVRLAMGWESDYSLPDDINWKEVLKMGSEQGIDAIVLDGYDVYLFNHPGVVSALKKPETRPLMLAAFGKLIMTESKSLQHLAALVELSKILNRKGIPFLLMKGFACGQYYPNPKHRVCGDIDIYPARYEESNKALEEAGIYVGSHYYRHSVSVIKEVMIENHRILCDLRGPKKQTRVLESQMEAEAEKSLLDRKGVRIQETEVPGAVFPSANFNALFLPWHFSAHFEFERVTIRHLLDWALFLIQDGKDIDVEMFREAKRKFTYGFSKIADILTNLSIRYLKIPIDSLPAPIFEDAMRFDNGLADRVFDYMFVGRPRERDKNLWKFRFNNVKRIWHERWKYREVYGMSFFGMLFYKIYGVLFKVGEED